MDEPDAAARAKVAVRLVSDVRAPGTAHVHGAGPAVVVGAFGWLLAHVVTFWLSTHSHPGMPDTARQLHSYAAAAAVVVAGLTAASVLTVSLATRRIAQRPPALRAGGVAGSVGLSTLVFLAADAIEHSTLGLDSTPPALLLLGALLHTLFGVGGSLVWLRFSGTVHAVLTWLRPPARPAARRPVRAPQRPRGHPRLLWAPAVAGRAPPLR